jgi:hypothetical protein
MDAQTTERVNSLVLHGEVFYVAKKTTISRSFRAVFGVVGHTLATQTLIAT